MNRHLAEVAKPIHRIKAQPGSLVLADDPRTKGYTEQIENPERIREIVGALVRHHSRGVLRHGELTVPVTPVAYASDLDAIRWRIEGVLGKLPAVIELCGFNSVFHLGIDRGFVDGEHLVSAMPSAILCVRRRWLRRYVVSSALTASFTLGAPPSILVGAVRDISYLGLAIETDVPVPSLSPATVIHGLRVRDESGKAAILDTEVRWVMPRLPGRGSVYGLKVLGVDGDERGWITLVDDQVHPGTRVGSALSEHVWDLYGRCGYFGLSGKRPVDFERRRRAFLSVSRQLDHAPHVGLHVTWPHREPEGATAALSALKVYQGTWLGFQMAKMSGDSEGVSGRKILREIHLRTYEHIQRDPDLAWVIAYPQAKRVWSALVHHDLPQRYVSSDEAAVVRFRALEFESTRRLELPGSDAVVDVGSPTDVEVLAKAVARLRPRAYCEALDLVPERMDMARNKRIWRGSRLERDRQILVARKDGRAVAGAVLEMAAEGTHLFGLLDLVRLFPMSDGGEEHFAHLIDAAREWFLEMGKSRFVCFLENGSSLPDAACAMANDMGEADMTILAAHRLPEMLEYLYEVTAPRT
ncbi:MAG: hypothetical protein HY698_05995 [Deltaproteobacteria bacterium]|nr:hypothetical protein [Deltaproteobacteria bacterium]